MLDKFHIGHYTDTENGTGVTAVIVEDGAVAGGCIRGAAPATRETDLLRNGKSVQKVNAVVLSGGSAFGLEAASGVMEFLREKGLGYDAGGYRVPIVAGASLYDLEYKNFAYPDKNAGYTAAKNAAPGNFGEGIIGVAAGTTASKILGMETAVKTGLGVALYSLNGLEIGVIAGVNPLGDIVKDGAIIAGAKMPNGEFADMAKIMTAGGASYKAANTTIAVVMTNAKLTKEEANILADTAHDGYALSISPSHTRFDGDAVFVMSSGEKKIEFNIIHSLIPSIVKEAVTASVNGTAKTEKRVSPVLFKIFQKMWGKR